MKTGFTLSEILITLVIIGFIGALGVPMLGSQKLKKPMEIKSRHGTMECFWENDRLMQFQANNTENKDGELKDVTDEGACYFTPPTSANLFVLQAVGAGGGGAVGLSGLPRYTPSRADVSGEIPTDTGFLAAISDTKKVPDWVRKEWNKQWTSSNLQGVEYTLTSPIGDGGDAGCDQRRIDFANGQYTDCSDLCTSGLEYLCPSRCIKELEAPGGASAAGVEVIVSAPIWYSPEGQQDSVIYTYNYNETKLEIGNKSVVLPSSKAGEDGKVNYPHEGEKKDGKDGEKYDLNRDAVISGFRIVKSYSVDKQRKGGTGCDKSSGERGLKGSITNNEPEKISFHTESLAVNATFGVAGSAGQCDMRLLEKLPSDTSLKLVPAKSNKGEDEATHSTIYKKNKETGGWDALISVGSGVDGWAGTEIIPVEEGDLPFPKVYFPQSFIAAIPQLTIASGAGYRSYLAKNNNSVHMPGASGAGAHPIILSVSGDARHRINGVTTGSEELKPIVSTDVRCFDGTKYGAGQPAPTYCGTGNTSGNPGAVVISW